MRKLLAGVAVAALFAPAIAGATNPNNNQSQGQNQVQGQAQLQGQVSKNANNNSNRNFNSSNSSAKSASRSASSANSGSLSGASSDQGQGQSQDDSTNVDGSWGFSYTDVPVTVPQAVATPDIAILSDSWKVGPLFGHSSQETESLPDGVLKTYQLVLLARGVARLDESGNVLLLVSQENYGYESAFAMQTALCAKDKKTARQLLYSCVE